MSTQVVIGLKDKATADQVAQGLGARGVQVRRFGRDQALKFGMRLGPLEGSPQEFIEVLQGGPAIVDAVADTLERLRDRVTLFLDREPAPATRGTLKTSFEQPETFRRTFGSKDAG